VATSKIISVFLFRKSEHPEGGSMGFVAASDPLALVKPQISIKIQGQ
jgi:hypothetical protein